MDTFEMNRKKKKEHKYLVTKNRIKQNKKLVQWNTGTLQIKIKNSFTCVNAYIQLLPGRAILTRLILVLCESGLRAALGCFRRHIGSKKQRGHSLARIQISHLTRTLIGQNSNLASHEIYLDSASGSRKPEAQV